MLKKIISVFLCVCILGSFSVFVSAADVDYTITNPYESVTQYLGNPENHYKTNIHTHSTISDADVDYADMIKEYYAQGFDILAFADHGVIGRNWNEEPQHLPIFLYQYILGNTVTKLTDEEYEAITGGTYPFEEGTRTFGRGMQCVPGGIELNNVTLTKSHVNGYFSDFDDNGGGKENGFEYAVKNVEKAGGISVINHPGDWLESKNNEDAARDPANVKLFGDILNEYKTCQGIEVLNGRDSLTHNDRVLWDELLQYVIPYGERNVFGFGNSDAHEFKEIDTSYMDFVLPEYSIENVKSTMTTGNFFAIGRRARNELGWDFVGTGAYPTVTSITVDEETDTITVTAKDAGEIQWIANGNMILSSTEKTDSGEVISVINLREYSDDITCYVRFQVLGDGGICMAQPFICDDGNMSRFIIEDNRTEFQKFMDELLYKIKSLRIYVVIQELVRVIKKEFE